MSDWLLSTRCSCSVLSTTTRPPSTSATSSSRIHHHLSDSTLLRVLPRFWVYSWRVMALRATESFTIVFLRRTGAQDKSQGSRVTSQLFRHWTLLGGSTASSLCF